MPLTKQQLLTCLDLLSPHMGVENERKAFITRALWESTVLQKITWSGDADTFTTNLLTTLHTYDDTHSLTALLRELRDDVGDPKRSEIVAFLTKLNGAPEPKSPPDSAPSVEQVEGVGQLFISYSRQDIDFVNRLRDDFTAHSIDYWIDAEALSPGTPSWEKALRAAIDDASGVVWVVLPSSFESRYVRDEIALAEALRRPLFPVWAAGENWLECVPLGRSEIQYVDMRGDRYADGFAQLVEALRGSRPELVIELSETEPEDDHQPENPYMGLRAFHEEDAHKFFGRTAPTERLVARLAAQMQAKGPRFLAVLGPSGAGKSSVVMAGLLPALKTDDESREWVYLPRMVPGTHPVGALAASLEAAMPSPPKKPIVGRLNILGSEYLDIVFEMLPGDHVVLYMDQFEELFTLTEDEGERQQFINLLTDAATDPDGKLIVLLSMRADFFGEPLRYDALGTLVRDYNEAVLPMSIAELYEAIEAPAKLPSAGLRFDTGLVAEIIFALRGRDKALAGALPLLQFTLERLY